MTKQQHLSWSSCATSATSNTRRRRGSGSSQTTRSFYPLHRSITDEESYADKPSPITRFVSKLLGLGTSSSTTPPSSSSSSNHRRRPPLAHKSHSTTSITKGGSVISSASTVHCDNNNTTPSVDLAVLDWKQVSPTNSSYSSTCSNDSAFCCDQNQKRLSCSCPASPPPPLPATNTTTTINSAAVDALVSAASQLEQQNKKQRLVDFLDIMEPPKLTGRRPDTEPVLDALVAEQIRSYLPRRYRLSNTWSLIYSLDQHGSSMATLYRLAKRSRGPCVLAIKDDNDSATRIHITATVNVFYGRKNEYMILSETDFIAIGGGDGKFGLWIKDSLYEGYSEQCPTFDNEPLSTTSDFHCIELELFALG
ncbi:hypothetical protein RO3G_05015 [Lichtheimia corymbifera JMRC:FSU:9682]|uniref:Oxidation resistance protein 1 n=1 Tax=Lichtheimia corymbifera JMRC:FSU:9682 TaxID=1263082 RepID=A0A068S1V1_9FUNG|nr:hypothetical protein RO3G_05015 [Lichtheimia corymbifera JMRC:FSU:9682]